MCSMGILPMFFRFCHATSCMTYKLTAFFSLRSFAVKKFLFFLNPDNMISITRGISISAGEVQVRFVHSSGPGGQNVNKLATACQIRFDALSCPALSQSAKDRLAKLAGRRMTAEGIVVIDARRYRTQQRNRDDAIDRLRTLLLRAVTPPKTRRKTTPTKASRQRRLDEKRQHSQTKTRRRNIPDQDS